jgi:pectate lyase
MRAPLLMLAIICGAKELAFGAEALAFPGAQGFGAAASGGRGGAVYHVTTLDDAGSGSLRDAVSQPHRTVVFDVGGYIHLKSVLQVASDITIAGQTAPGEGISTLGYEVSFSRSKNVIVRYMRFRQGATPKQEKKSAVSVFGGSNMIFDHCSIEWGRWDCIDINESDRVTFQNCIIGRGIAPQRFGCLCQSDHITFTHNLWIDNQSRNPKAKGNPIQYVNNVVYNWGGGGGFIEGHSEADHFADVVNNVFIAGPNSGGHGAFAQGKPTDKIYCSGNYIDSNANGKMDGRTATDQDLGDVTPQKSPASELDQLAIDPTEKVFEKVIATAGCSLHRDEVDRALIAEVESLGASGKIIQDPTDAGGPGEITGGTAPKDSDGDGIPDAYESAHGLNPHDPTDANRVGPDGYTSLEQYLNGLATAADAK